MSTRNTDAYRFTAKDQVFKNCIFRVVQNKVTGKLTVRACKRNGFGNFVTFSSTQATQAIRVQSQTNTVAAGGTAPSGGILHTVNTLSTVITDIGTVANTADIRFLSETLVSGTTWVMVLATDGAGYFYAFDAIASFSGTTTSGSPIVPSIASTTGLYKGMPLSGTGIAANTRIQSVDSATQITMTINATANGTPTITSGKLAKIIDANFPSNIVGNFAFLGGWAFVMDTRGRIWNSNLNDPSTWSAIGLISCDIEPDKGAGVVRYKNHILGFGASSIEWFKNQGNPTGSPLVSVPDLMIRTGAKDPINSVYTRGYSILPVDDALYWVGRSSVGTFVIYAMQGGPPKIVSDDIVAGYLYEIASGVTVNGLSAMKISGKTLLLVHLYSGDALVLDTELGMWSVWSGAMHWSAVMYEDDIQAFLAPDSGSSHALRLMSPPGSPTASYLDGASTFTQTVQTSRIDHGTQHRKFVRELDLVCATQSSGAVTVEISDNDYSSYTTLVSTLDLTSMSPRITRLGSHRGGRSYRFTHTANAPNEMEAFDLMYDVGTA